MNELDYVLRFITGGKRRAEPRGDRWLRDTASDRASHVEVKGKRKGSRRERRAKR